MELLLAFVGGVVLTCIGAWLVLRGVKTGNEKALEKALEDAAVRAESEKKAAIAGLESDLKNAKENTSVLLEAKEVAHKDAMAEIERRHSEAIEAMEKRHNEAIVAERTRFDETIGKVKAELKITTDEVLKKQQEELKKSNSSNMEQIVNPLKETITKMEEALKENKTTQVASTETIKERIATLVETTMKVSSSADRLSNALTAESKTQGNWGELKLEALLNAMGLEEGLEYEAQEFLRDGSGNILVAGDSEKKMQPDVILHLDETRDLIIDSKVSLSAFSNYQNAETEEDKKIALAAHVKSVQNHVRELAKKNYSAYVKAPRSSVDFVMMFVPIDAALQLALVEDQTLWRSAMEMGVFVVGEQNLYAALRAVKVTWGTIKQNANNRVICETAEELLNRVGDLMERVDAMGKHLENVSKAYGKVREKATEGNQSVLGSAKKLEKLGVKASNKHPLPALGELEEIGMYKALPEEL